MFPQRYFVDRHHVINSKSHSRINLQNQHYLVEPIDFENFVYKNKTLIQNDPQRELLLYPNDDVSVSGDNESP